MEKTDKTKKGSLRNLVRNMKEKFQMETKYE